MKRRPYTDRSKEPTIYCENPKCDNVSSKLHFVEEKVIDGLKKWLEQYQFDYQEHIEKINRSKIELIEDTIKSLQDEVKKENDKLLNIFNFLEDGTYTKEMFKARSESVSQNVARLNNAIEEYKARLEQEKIVDNGKSVLVPKIENILDIYNLLKTPEEKNELLKTVWTQVTYLKTEKAIKKNSDPTNFIINLYPKINKEIIWILNIESIERYWRIKEEKLFFLYNKRPLLGANELAHLEMVGTIVHQLTEGLTADEIKAVGLGDYYTDHGVDVYPQSAAGTPFTAAYIAAKGDPIANLQEDLAAEQKARATYEKLIDLCSDDPDVLDPLRFLRQREIVHFQRFGEALRGVQDKLAEKRFFMNNCKNMNNNCDCN